MRTLKVYVLQHFVTGDLTLTCRNPSHLKTSNKIVQTYTLTDTTQTNLPSRHAKQSLVARTSSFTAQYPIGKASANLLEKMIESVTRFDTPSGSLLITKEHNQPLARLVSLSLKSLRNSVQTDGQKYEIYVYVNTTNFTLSLLQYKSLRKTNALVCAISVKDSKTKRQILANIQTLLGSTKALTITTSTEEMITQTLKDFNVTSDSLNKLFEKFNQQNT